MYGCICNEGDLLKHSCHVEHDTKKLLSWNIYPFFVPACILKIIWL